MKRKILCAILIIALTLLSLSCSAVKKEPDIYAFMQKLSENENRGIMYLYRTRNTENGDFPSLTPEKLGYLYTGKFQAPECYDRILEYAIRLPADLSGGEIHIIRCIDRSDTIQIGALVQKRIDRLQASDVLWIAPETHEKYFKGAQVYTKGRYVFLLATADNLTVIKHIDRML